MFFCIVGMDGSGKTTLTRNIVAALRDRGVPAEYVYGRFQPVLMRPIMAMVGGVLLRGRRGSGNYAAYAVRRRRLFANPVLYALYQASLAVDYLLQVAWRIRIPLWRGRRLICDRYYLDTVVADIAIDTKRPDHTANWLLALYRHLLPRPDMILMTDVPANVAVARKDDIPSLEYAEELRALYLHAARQCGVVVLDGTTPPDTLLQSALERLGFGNRTALESLHV